VTWCIKTADAIEARIRAAASAKIAVMSQIAEFDALMAEHKDLSKPRHHGICVFNKCLGLKATNLSAIIDFYQRLPFFGKCSDLAIVVHDWCF